MERFSTQVILVSEQPVPNLTPILDPRTRPDKVILVTSSSMQQRAGWIISILRPTGVQCEQFPVQNPWDMELLQEEMLQLVVRLEQENVVLNATGGTKPMSIAAYEMFREARKPIFYVHPHLDRIHWLFPRQSEFDLADRIKLPQFITAYGAKIIQQGSQQGENAELRELTELLIKQLDYFSYPLRLLNRYAAQASSTLQSIIDSEHRNVDAFLDLLDQLELRKILRVNAHRIYFSTEDSRFYCNGGWLENHLFSLLFGLRKEVLSIQDIGRSVLVEYQTRNDKVTNELDVCFLADNRMYMLECKTRHWKGEAGVEENSIASALYKLASLKDQLGGYQAKAMLLSYFPIDKHDLNRAKELKIEIIDGMKLRQAKGLLKQWIQ